jgi:hypothetical protein
MALAVFLLVRQSIQLKSSFDRPVAAAAPAAKTVHSTRRRFPSRRRGARMHLAAVTTSRPATSSTTRSGRQMEERRCPHGVARHDDEELFAPDGHTGRFVTRIISRQEAVSLQGNSTPNSRASSRAFGTSGSCMNPYCTHVLERRARATAPESAGPVGRTACMTS